MGFAGISRIGALIGCTHVAPVSMPRITLRKAAQIVPNYEPLDPWLSFWFSDVSGPTAISG